MSILKRVACAGAAAILSPMIAAAPAHAAPQGAYRPHRDRSY